jgi:hypothetical protein
LDARRRARGIGSRHWLAALARGIGSRHWLATLARNIGLDDNTPKTKLHFIPNAIPDLWVGTDAFDDRPHMKGNQAVLIGNSLFATLGAAYSGSSLLDLTKCCI